MKVIDQHKRLKVDELVGSMNKIDKFGLMWSTMIKKERDDFKDVLVEFLLTNDRLGQMFQRQAELYQNLIDSGKMKFIPKTKDYLTEAIGELSEAMAEIEHKWWKQTEKPNRDLFLEEINDSFHFIMDAIMEEGFTDSDFFNGTKGTKGDSS